MRLEFYAPEAFYAPGVERDGLTNSRRSGVRCRATREQLKRHFAVTHLKDNKKLARIPGLA